MVVERRFVKVLVDSIVSLEHSITEVAIHSAFNDTKEVADLLLDKIKQKNEMVEQLKKIKNFMQKLPALELKIFDLYFVKGAEVSNYDCNISIRQRFRIIARLKKELEEKLL